MSQNDQDLIDLAIRLSDRKDVIHVGPTVGRVVVEELSIGKGTSTVIENTEIRSLNIGQQPPTPPIDVVIGDKNITILNFHGHRGGTGNNLILSSDNDCFEWDGSRCIMKINGVEFSPETVVFSDIPISTHRDVTDSKDFVFEFDRFVDYMKHLVDAPPTYSKHIHIGPVIGDMKIGKITI